MRGRAIRAGLAATVVAMGLAIPGAAPAQAGGGCHAGLTQGRGDTVEMVDACFTPSILRVDPGTEVTFVNRDHYVHNVGGNEWGMFEHMFQGDAFTATFSRPGIYPFACSYHPGMNGAVVVGDGTGAGSGERVTAASLTGSKTESKPSGPLAVASTTDRGSAAGWIGGGILGLAVGASLGLAWRRRPGEATLR
jgi:plastocyanin